MVLNVEYNQLDPLLRATGHADGDVNDASGYSPYPGNINQVRVFFFSCVGFSPELEVLKIRMPLHHGNVIYWGRSRL